MKEHPIQASGYFDVITNEYALTVTSGSLVVSLDFLKKEDIEHLVSCLSCMLVTEEESDEQ
jgi:hypothetical protein